MTIIIKKRMHCGFEMHTVDFGRDQVCHCGHMVNAISGVPVVHPSDKDREHVRQQARKLHVLTLFEALPEERQDALLRNLETPLEVILVCPSCGKQHVDAPDPPEIKAPTRWNNPPHRSHLCYFCGCIWRAANVPTNGAEFVKSRGKVDTWP